MKGGEVEAVDVDAAARKYKYNALLASTYRRGTPDAPVTKRCWLGTGLWSSKFKIFWNLDVDALSGRSGSRNL